MGHLALTTNGQASAPHHLVGISMVADLTLFNKHLGTGSTASNVGVSARVTDSDQLYNECSVFLQAQRARVWPQYKTDALGQNIRLGNPIESIFYHALLRMSPEGISSWQASSFLVRELTNDHFQSCLYVASALGCDEQLQELAETVSTGEMSILEAMAWLDCQPLPIPMLDNGNGWFEQMWNLFKLKL